MSTPLEVWQERLERHFHTLASTRAKSGLPLFALEHDLSDEELEEASNQLRHRIEARLRLAPYWLVGAVYATERGYAYAGDEYWPSFEEQTPGWEFPDRYKVVPWFDKFQRTYHGVIPSGPWAEHFRIIAWPITHAILPRYLQRQFARALYDLRFRLAGVESLEPAAIGRILAANSYHASTRFQEFLQQEQLTGRIVLALLHEDSGRGQEPIYPPTLVRIVSDLEQVRNAREWLREAQRVVTERFKGIGRGTGPPGRPATGAPAGPVTESRAHPDIRPHLLLRYAGSATWSVLLEVPAFKSLAALNAEIRSFLRRTRCRLNGADDAKPAGWLLSGTRRAVLKSWPDPRKPLIAFEHANGTVDNILESDCRMAAGPLWLFRIGRDGTAREIAGRVVRPGQEYIVLTNEALPPLLPGISACTVACSGIRSIRIKVPADVSAEYIRWLHDLGLELARTIRVWPAGLPGRGWDGEGNSEWLTTEAPCFGITHDHPVDAYILCLDGGSRTLVRAGGVGYPVFVQIPPLPSGTYTLTVKAQRSEALTAIVQSPPAEGLIQLKVREPETWVPGAPAHTGLIVTLDPHDADLDTLWQNKARLSVLGPPSHQVVCKLSLETGDGEQILSDQVGGPMNLPLTPDAWGKRFADFVNDKDRAWRYLEAAAGTLTIQAEELGQFTLRFERAVLPLRWVLRNVDGSILVKLIDDTGKEGEEPQAIFFSMSRPPAQNRLSSDVRSGHVVQPPGGLFVAQHGEYRDEIIVSAGLTGTGLKGLGVTSRCDELLSGSVSLTDAFHVLEMWLNARLAGFLSDFRRQKVADAFLLALYTKLCGPSWGKAESYFYDSRGADRAIDVLQRVVQKHSGFGVSLRRDYTRMPEEPASRSAWYAEKAHRYGICSDPKLCDFALRLASQPQRMRQAYATELGPLLDRVGDSPALVRGARLLALLCARQDHSGRSDLLPRWRWQLPR